MLGIGFLLPVLFLTLWGDAYAGTLDVASVKIRFGPQDAMGKKFITMTAQPAVCKIEEREPDAPPLFRDGVDVHPDDKVNVWGD